jgi:hypothetical protein
MWKIDERAGRYGVMLEERSDMYTVPYISTPISYTCIYLCFARYGDCEVFNIIQITVALMSEIYCIRLWSSNNCNICQKLDLL